MKEFYSSRNQIFFWPFETFFALHLSFYPFKAFFEKKMNFLISADNFIIFIILDEITKHDWGGTLK